MTKKELVRLQRDSILAVARKHNMEQDDNDNLYWKDHSVTYRIKVKRNCMVQERFSSGRDKWVRMGSYHIKRVNMEKWEQFCSTKSFDLQGVV